MTRSVDEWIGATDDTRPPPRPCVIDGCCRRGKSHAGGHLVCSMHYQRWVRIGSFDLPNRVQSPDGRCTVKGCGKPTRSRAAGLCEAHYVAGRRATIPKPPRKHTDCVRCGAALPIGKQLYCCRRCQTRASRGTPSHRSCKFCGSTFAHPGSRTVFCSPSCAQGWRDAYYYERRLRIRHVSPEKFKREDIFERDAWRCQLCGEKVRRDVHSRHPDAPSLDHIIPLARGGTHSRINAQTLHLKCNCRKHARSIGQLRLFG